jgi:non-specific serine/threonine protein kinase
MIDEKISHYKILKKLGEGGMGEVYLADDLKLDRKVAIKFLPEHLTKDKENIERFEREAKAAAALNHPNIITIYDVIESEKQVCIVMEFVDGESLRTKIDNGVSDLDEILDIIKQICEGLTKAHQAEIVHRDIKTENILIDSDGRVKILDFGLAKLKGVSKLSKESSTLGTVHYMSPEQLQGKEVDNRSDIWSLGIVLYELLTGKPPFGGEYESAVQYAILNEEPETLAGNIPEGLINVANKCLHKNPQDRYQSTEELLQDIKTATIPSKQPDRKEKSIIVLPFDDLSPDKDNEYFSDGLTEEIISDLSQIHDLLVISRSSAMTFKGSMKKIKQIAYEVNVRYVLEGSVRKAGNNLRITAQLIDANNDTHLWANKYNGTLDDVFDIQEKVSCAIADVLKTKLNLKAKHSIAERPIKNVQVYECYLRARQETLLFSKDAMDRALQYLQNGLDIIGENPVLYAGMGYVYYQYVNIGEAQEEYIKKAEDYAKRALVLDKKSSEAHLVLGLINQAFQGNQKESIHHLKLAFAITPYDPHVLLWLIVAYSLVGRPEEARPLLSLLQKVDPLTPMNKFMEVFQELWEGRLDLPVEHVMEWFHIEPQNPFALFFSSLFLAYCKHFKEARILVDENVQADSNDVATLMSLLVKFAVEVETARIEQIVTGGFAKTAQRDPQLSYFVAGLHAFAGMRDAALDWLANAVNRGFINYPFINEHDPFLENIRGEERFKKLMKQVKYEWENFEV